MKALNRDQLPKAAIGATAAKKHFVRRAAIGT